MSELGESEVRPGPPKLGAPHGEARRRGIASSGHASRRSADLPPPPPRASLERTVPSQLQSAPPFPSARAGPS